ncbi:MAG: insulinase family protein, partial [Acidobacteriota bacterium]|nr:insulinase family protein [Acidobacteriota bacterium]
MKKNKSMTALLGLALLTQLTLSAWAQKNPKDQFDFPPLNPLKIPPVKQVTLKNGIRLFLIEDNRFPTIDMAGVLAGGSAFEPADKAGLASLTGTVLRTGGTRNMTGDELDRELESMAASIETGFGDTSGSIAVSMLKENVDRVLSLLADILEKPV